MNGGAHPMQFFVIGRGPPIRCDGVKEIFARQSSNNFLFALIQHLRYKSSHQLPSSYASPSQSYDYFPEELVFDCAQRQTTSANPADNIPIEFRRIIVNFFSSLIDLPSAIHTATNLFLLTSFPSSATR